MAATTRTRYAVVSCHVERPLDDAVWAAFARLQERRPGGFAVAALMRPPDPVAGEDEALWLERARAAALRAPLGHHTHWTSPTHARPTSGDPAERVAREGAWLRERGLEPTLFCGGGWYTDAEVAAACADLGYVDCTPRANRPTYLEPGAAWVELPQPAQIRLENGSRLLAVPTTHTIGDLARTVWRPARPGKDVVHVYLHDTDLVEGRRRLALELCLAVLGRRWTATDLDTLAEVIRSDAVEIEWAEAARGTGAVAGPQ
jgi:hypothetical protein